MTMVTFNFFFFEATEEEFWMARMMTLGSTDPSVMHAVVFSTSSLLTTWTSPESLAHVRVNQYQHSYEQIGWTI